MRKPKTKYNVRVPMEGFSAYALDKIVESGIYGKTREEVIDYIIKDWSSLRWNIISDLEVKVEEARRLGYLSRRK